MVVLLELLLPAEFHITCLALPFGISSRDVVAGRPSCRDYGEVARRFNER
jgi:hypothetical protein